MPRPVKLTLTEDEAVALRVAAGMSIEETGDSTVVPGSDDWKRIETLRNAIAKINVALHWDAK